MQTNSYERCINILKELIAVDTCNPPGNEARLVDTILKITRPSADSYKVLSIAEGRSNLMLELKGKSNLTIGFAGHLDTVPTGDLSIWTSPPFAGTIENGYLYGRGASDMRGGLTAMLMLYLYYADNGITPPVTLQFFFTADEESAGAGITACLNNGWLKDLSQLFICEPTNCQPGIAEKGAVWIEAVVKGKSSHAAIPQKGVNALEYGLIFMNYLKSTVECLPVHPLLGPCTCSITRAAAGIKTNSIPDRANFSADIRIGPGIANDRVISLAQEEAYRLENSQQALEITLNITNNREALEVANSSPLLNKLRTIYEELQFSFVPTGILFYTDASLVIPFIDLPFIILGPGEQSECHCVDERIQIKSIEQAFDIYHSYVEAYFIS